MNTELTRIVAIFRASRKGRSCWWPVACNPSPAWRCRRVLLNPSLPLPTGFHRLPRSYEGIRLLDGRRPVVVASFRPTARTPSLTREGVPFGPMKTSQGTYCRSRPQYRSNLGWTLGVAFLGTLIQPAGPWIGGASPLRGKLEATASRRQLHAGTPTPRACGATLLASGVDRSAGPSQGGYLP
jgi:hypothetical protein